MLHARFRPIYDSEMPHILLKRALLKILIVEVKIIFLVSHTGWKWDLQLKRKVNFVLFTIWIDEWSGKLPE